MADLSYGEGLAQDAGGRKMLSALTDNSGTNEFTALRGVNRQTQNGEPVADLAVAPAGITATGQQTMANSLPVAIASDQSAVPVAPAGITATGQQTMANSLPVVIASNQSTLVVNDVSNKFYVGRAGGNGFTAVSTRNFSVTGYGTPGFIGGGSGATQVIVRCTSGTLYVGDSDVVPETGFQLDQGDTWVFDLGPGLMLFGVAMGNATATANIMEFTTS